jgi:hypothetical protein
LVYQTKQFIKKFTDSIISFSAFITTAQITKGSTLLESEQRAGNIRQGGIKGWNVGISLSPGISYALTNKFHLEMGFHNLAFLGYGRAKSESIPVQAPLPPLVLISAFKLTLEQAHH